MSRGRACTILAQLAAQGIVPSGIAADSRKLQSGELFAAWPGLATDGRRFIADAIARGASAVLWDTRGGFRAEGLNVPGLAVEDLRTLAGHLAHEIHGRPSEALWVAGVTGTNGKTTVGQWLAVALTELGQRCGIVGTLGSGYPGQLVDALNTTPDATELHRLMRGFVEDGAQAVAMEVSSIGLDQGRVNGVAFDLAVFTNLSRDHLDYHKDMEAYAEAKARLFNMPGITHAVFNLDEPFGLAQARRLATASDVAVIGYTLTAADVPALPGVDVLAAGPLSNASTGTRFAIHWAGRQTDVRVGTIAPFNVSNLLAVTGALLARGVELEDAVRVVTKLSPPPGRMELLGGVCEPLVVIDYAHSPDALAKVLEAVRDTVSSRGGRLTCVFGCGGDRDPGKRPLMGEIAQALADRVVITSDNPRSERPESIVRDILAGSGPSAEIVLDRAAAISLAVGEAGPNDVVVIAGKGHEPYQEIQGKRAPFSDKEQARRALIDWNRARGDEA